MGNIMIFNDFFKSLGQIGDPVFRSVFLKGISLTLFLFLVIFTVFATIIGWFIPDTIDLIWVGEVTWIDNALSWAAIPLMILFSVFLMVPVASAFTGIFLDEVAEAVEAEHYPHLPKAPPTPLAETLRDTAHFLGVMIGLNTLALLVYVIFAPLAPFIFWALNGALLGREYFQMAAMRRIGRTAAYEMRKKHRGTVWIAGILMAMPLSIPIVNLFVPILGAATFTHLFQRLR